METSSGTKTARRNIACDECKRRKVRCSAEPNCANCRRDGKKCTYSSPVHRASALERTVNRYQALVISIKKAWSIYLPNVPLEQALDDLEVTASSPRSHNGSIPSIRGDDLNAAVPEDGEADNADDFEFDESQEFNDAIDGMSFLTLEPSKSGYTGPHSGIAALKVLRSLPSANSLEETEEALIGPRGETAPNAHRKSDVGFGYTEMFIDDYFKFYHPSYPLLHEGTFRARLSGALAKPRDGSWPLLYNMVLALGAFTGDSRGSNSDLVYFRAAKQVTDLSIIEKGSLSYLQGVSLMADYLQKRNKPNAGFALFGIAWSMAMGIGLHREFGQYGTTPFSMELRRRTWWSLYVSISAAQLTIGRPPASLIGVNVRPPHNLEDRSLVVDMEELPAAQDGPTVTSCLIAQVPLAMIANEVQDAVSTHQHPPVDFVDRLDRDIENWSASLPPYMTAQTILEPRFEQPKRVLLWRSYHLRIVLNRPFLFEAINKKADITAAPNIRIQRCIATADACVASICQFLDENSDWTRGFAWYATYWLISGSFVHAICCAYAPEAEQAEAWKALLQQAIQALQKLSFAHVMADRALRILEKFHDRYTIPSSSGEPRSTAPLSQFMADNFLTEHTQNNPMQWMGTENDLQGGGPIAFGSDADIMWSWQQPGPNAEFLDAAGGNFYQDYQDGFSTLYPVSSG